MKRRMMVTRRRNVMKMSQMNTDKRKVSDKNRESEKNVHITVK